MSDVKQVKVDNWGIYFLQRLKHFFNRTDYCDLTLQFQDNAQLKVHRLVLSACTEYFEVLERTCEMYEDCLVMPDDLQADVVVPIVNFMYTGQLEFRMDILDKLYQTSEIMNMTVLTKLLDSHRPKKKIYHSYPAVKRVNKPQSSTPTTTTPKDNTVLSSINKRSYSKAFSKNTTFKDKKINQTIPKKSVPVTANKSVVYKPMSPVPFEAKSNKKQFLGDPRPTRYELPEDLDTDNIFENSFTNISYASQPLMIHPEARKQYSKKPRQDGPSSSKKFGTVDIVPCKSQKDHEDNIFEDSLQDRISDDSELFKIDSFVKMEEKDSSQLFDQILDQSDDFSKVTIETSTKNKKSTPNSANLDHAKIISEVLKKYPHLVKSNKNIKLKILNTPAKNVKKLKSSSSMSEKSLKNEIPEPDFTYETDVIDSKHAAKLIALGAENIEGPWICLICGTPGRALHFTSYFKYRRHLVEVHNEKPVLSICEYCGQKLNKRNCLLHHMYTKHGVEPPPQYHFPKCNQCNYIALTEGLLVKHKLTHAKVKSCRSNYASSTESLNVKHKTSEGKFLQFHCNVCSAAFSSGSQLLTHIQNTGHKYKKQIKANFQCVYCLKAFLQETNLYAHLKSHHKMEAQRDGIIDDSDDEAQKDNYVKYESSNEYEDVGVQYQIQQRPDGNIHVVTKKQNENAKHKILNPGFSGPSDSKPKITRLASNIESDFVQEINIPNAKEEIVMIDNNEYIVKGNKLIPRKPKQNVDEYMFPSLLNSKTDESLNISTSMEFTEVQNTHDIQQANLILKNTDNLNEPIPIYVSNDEEYKALMSSNHPIIFDTTDANKTLTVLTAPQSLETTTIDLDNTQSNDMMIIQDEYPLSVTESVTPENSNIVVVYSHQVDNQNKEYQLLTTQALEPKFVQSSAIITQNFETITTTAPVMAGHVLDTPVTEVWQSDMHQNIENETVTMSTVSGLQQIVQPDTMQIVQQDAVQILPQDAVQIVQQEAVQIMQQDAVQLVQQETVQLVQQDTVELVQQNTSQLVQQDITQLEQQETVQIAPDTNIEISEKPESEVVSNDAITSEQVIIGNENVIIEETSVAEAMDITHTEQIVTENMPEENVSDMTVEAEMPTEEISEPQINVPLSTELTSEVVPEQEIEQLTDEYKPEIQANPEVIEEIVTSENHENVQQSDEQTEVLETPDVNEDETGHISEDLETAVEITEVEPSPEMTDITKNIEQNEPPGHATEVIDKIQNLTSEWSEDDTNTPPQHMPIEEAVSNEISNQNTLEKNEYEESIENIKHEVDKQMTEQPRTVAEEQHINENQNMSIEEEEFINDNSPKIDKEPENNQESVTAIATETSETVKLSALLNDWEDSQEEKDDNETDTEASLMPSKEEETNKIDSNEAIIDDNSLNKTEIVNKDDNIKNLVSDWDDEEEEIK